MTGFRWLICGFLAACAIGLVTAGVFLLTARGLSAKEEPSVIERWIARRARMAAVPRDAASKTNPVPDTPEILAEARAHWADHCASCHGNDGSGESLMGKRTYPPAPDMRRPGTQQMSDGALFYVIQNGVRMTAMPAWGGSAHGEIRGSWYGLFAICRTSLSRRRRRWRSSTPRARTIGKKKRKKRDF